MGRGSGVKFDVTLDSHFEVKIKNTGPEWVKKADLGVKIGKKKEFTDCVVVPIVSVTMEAAYSSATVKGYDDQPAIGYLLIGAKEINEAINEEISVFKAREFPGAKITDFRLEIHGLSRPVIYSGGYVRSRFPSDGQIEAGKVDLTVYFELVRKNGMLITDSIGLDGVEGTLYFPNQDGYIPFERWMPQEYDQITVRQAYDGIDELWSEDEDE